jgi:hypothetical protein
MDDETRLREGLRRKGYTSFAVNKMKHGQTLSPLYLVSVDNRHGVRIATLSGSFGGVSRRIDALPDR